MKSHLETIWGSAVGMMLVGGLFGGGHPVVMAIPPIAAGATPAFVLNHDERKRTLPSEQSDRVKQLEARLETLEAIVTQEDQFLPHAPSSSSPSSLNRQSLK